MAGVESLIHFLMPAPARRDEADGKHRLAVVKAVEEREPEREFEHELEGELEPESRRVTVAQVSVWSVTKLALLFWTGVALVLATAVLLMWQMLVATGIIDNVEGFVADLFDDESFQLATGPLLLGLLLAMSAFIAAATTFTFITVSLYNMLSRLVGGLTFEVTEESESSAVLMEPPRTS